jgi:DNA-binding beta-propeller fold protein YncE
MHSTPSMSGDIVSATSGLGGLRQKGGIRMRRRFVPRALGLLTAGLVVIGALPSPALASPGEQLWSRKFSTGGNHFDEGDKIAVSPDGSRVFVTGDIRSNSGYMTIAYDASTGAQLWQSQWYSTYPINGAPADIAVGPLGTRVYVTGAIGNGHNYDFGTVAYDAATGDRIWRKRYDGPAGGDDQAYGLAVSPNGHTVYVAGESDGATGSAATTIAYNSKNGTQEWLSRLTPNRTENGFEAIAVSSDGSRLYATGQTGRPAILVAAQDAATGDTDWTKTYQQAGDELDFGTNVALTPDDATLVVGGTTISTASNYNWATLAYDTANGARRWARTVDRGQGDLLTGLAISPTGSAVAATGIITPHNSDAATIVYAVATGDVVWKRAYDDPVGGGDFAKAVAYSPDGKTLYMTGEGAVVTGSRFITIAYDASTGDREWQQRSSDRGPVPYAGANDVAVAPDGSAVYVTGYRYQNARDADFLTIAYGA